jgi:hypothetical protein
MFGTAADHIGLTKGPLVRNLTTDGQHCAGVLHNISTTDSQYLFPSRTVANEDSFHAVVSNLTPMNTSQQEPLRMVLNLLHV